MNKISIGIIGAGSIVTTMHLPILYTIPEVNVSYIADVEEKRLLSSAFNAKFIKIGNTPIGTIPKTDAIFLATPLGARDEYIKAQELGSCSIFTEKPFVANFDHHKQLIGAIKKIVCNYNRQFFSTIRSLKRIIDSSLLGNLEVVKIAESAMPRGTGKSPNHYQFNKRLSGGGLLIERGCHTLSQIDFLFSNFLIKVTDCKIRTIKGIDVDIDLDLEVVLNNNSSIPINYKLSAGRLFNTASLYSFDKGNINFNHTDACSKLKIYDNCQNMHTIENIERFATTEIQSFYLSWISFLEKVKGIQKFSPEIDTSIRTTEIIEAAYRKAGLL